MSGTSLDGLDICFCEFTKRAKWTFKIISARTIPYTQQWKEKLSAGFTQSKQEIARLDMEFGTFIGKKISAFVRKNKFKPDFISSHGHTILHQPEKKITSQIGDGKTIACICKLPVVCDFRSADIALGGQGAPLVPVADKLLFPQYDCCLNLGGFANVSYDDVYGLRRAFDICPVNIVLNRLSKNKGKEFDRNGTMASEGTIHEELLKKLNSLHYYQKPPPKSLGREWVEKNILPILDIFPISADDKLRTYVEHIAVQVSGTLIRQFANTGKSVLVTGGGAYNIFLIKRITALSKCHIVLPDDFIIQFKEAFAFAFLGILKMRKEINVLKSVTGAKKNHSSGKIFLP